MYEFMKLEMRKHRFLFRGIVGAFFGTVLMSALLALSSHQPPLQFAALTTLCWMVGGWGLMPMLYGATSGAGLRGEPAASAEAGLPLAPFKKMAGALAAMWIYFTGLGCIIGLFALLLSPQIEGGKFSLPAGSEIGQIAGFVLAALFIGFLMILISFTCAYAFRHAIFGGMIGMLLCGTIAVGLVFGAMTHVMLGPDTLRSAIQSVGPGLLLILLLTTAGAFLSLHRLAQWGERRVKPGWLGWLLIGLGLGVGAFSAAGWLANGYSSLSRQLLFRPNNWTAFNFNNDPALAYLDDARKAAEQHTLLLTRSGGLVSVSPGGKRTLLMPEEPRNPVELMKNPWGNRIVSYDWDSDGSLWVLVRTDIADESQLELWHGNSDGPLKNHTYFKAPAGLHPGRLAHRGTVVGVVAQTDGYDNPNQFAPMPPLGKAPVFETLGEILKGKAKDYREDDFLLASWTDSGLRARISDDGKSLTRRLQGGGTQSWTLPEGATAINLSSPYHRLIEAGSGKFFLVSVKLPDATEAVAILRLDGSARLEWRGKAAPLYEIQNNEFGQLFLSKHSVKTAAIVFMVSPDGRFLPPLELNDPWISALPGHNPAAGKQDFSITPLRMKSSHVWLLAGDNDLLEVDCETGKLVKQWPLPNFNASARNKNSGINSTVGPISETGFNYIASGQLYHAGFDGVTKDLGPARLE